MKFENFQSGVLCCVQSLRVLERSMVIKMKKRLYIGLLVALGVSGLLSGCGKDSGDFEMERGGELSCAVWQRISEYALEQAVPAESGRAF